MNSSIRRGVALAVLALTNTVHAEDESSVRIRQLEAMMQQMMEQRAEQDRQMQVMAEELKAMQQQMANGKESDLKDRGKSTGAPVYAAFKDGISFEDGSGNWQMAINGRIQADYRHFNPDETGADTFSLRRARLGGTLTFYKDFVARVEGEYAAGNTSLTYGYFDINKFKQARLRMGQFKPFYGLERSMSTNLLDFQERSWGDALLGSTYDRGVMVHGSPLAGLYYSLAYINGTGTSDENNARNDHKDTTLRVAANFAEMAQWKDVVAHVGGWWGYGREGSRRQASFIPTGQTEARGLQFFSTACTATNGAGNCGAALANGFADNVDRQRGGFETSLAYGPVKLQGEYFHLGYDGPNYSRDINTWYASALWNVTGESFAAMYKEGVFGRLKPKNSYNSAGDGWGALQLGVRYSKFDASDFSSTNANGTGVLLNNPAGTAEGLLVATNEADAWTLGANWIINPNVRFVMNYVHTDFDTPVTVRVNGKNSTQDGEDALTLRAQFDF